jgi:hypothetical protein
MNVCIADIYNRETNLAHKYPSLTPEEVSRAVSVCAVESVGRVSASPYPDLPGVMDTWFLQCLRCNKMHPGSFLVLLSGLYALEKFGTTGHERTPPDYLQAFQDLINGRGVILDSFTEIYSVVASTVLRNAPGSTFRYIHPDFTSSVEIPENERQRIWEYLRNEMLEMETCEEDLCRRSRGLAVE